MSCRVAGTVSKVRPTVTREGCLFWGNALRSLESLSGSIAVRFTAICGHGDREGAVVVVQPS